MGLIELSRFLQFRSVFFHPRCRCGRVHSASYIYTTTKYFIGKSSYSSCPCAVPPKNSTSRQKTRQPFVCGAASQTKLPEMKALMFLLKVYKELEMNEKRENHLRLTRILPKLLPCLALTVFVYFRCRYSR